MLPGPGGDATSGGPVRLEPLDERDCLIPQVSGLTVLAAIGRGPPAAGPTGRRSAGATPGVGTGTASAAAPFPFLRGALRPGLPEVEFLGHGAGPASRTAWGRGNPPCRTSAMRTGGPG